MTPPAVAPFGRRAAAVTGVERHGPYVALRALDADGPHPAAGQFYMLRTEHGWGGGEDGRPYLSRAFSFARATPRADGGVELVFLLEEVGPGTRRLAACEAGENLLLAGPFGNSFEAGAARRAVLVAGGVGLAPVAALAAELRESGGAEPVVLIGMRGSEHARAAAALNLEHRLATDDGSAGTHGLVTELLVEELDTESDCTVYACGPPAMLETVRALCAERGVPSRLAMESEMACGFGACHGCVVPTRDGYKRLCVDGPVLDGEMLETALVAGAGH